MKNGTELATNSSHVARNGLSRGCNYFSNHIQADRERYFGVLAKLSVNASPGRQDTC